MPLTLDDLRAALAGERPTESRNLAYSLPLSATQVADLTPLLQDNKELHGLRLRGCKLDDEAADNLSRALAFNTSLRSLDLRDNQITDVGAQGPPRGFKPPAAAPASQP